MYIYIYIYIRERDREAGLKKSFTRCVFRTSLLALHGLESCIAVLCSFIIVLQDSTGVLEVLAKSVTKVVYWLYEVSKRGRITRVA